MSAPGESVRVRVGPAAWFVAGTLVVAALLTIWLARAEPVDAAVRGVRQQRALVLALFVLATFVIPWAFDFAAGRASRRAVLTAYAVSLPAPLLLVTLGAWFRPSGDPSAILMARGAVLLFAYGVLVCAATDASRVASPELGVLLPMVAGTIACLSPFVAGRWVEHAPDHERRESRIAWVVAVNPLLAATTALPDYDPLRAEHVYERTPIGAYFVYRLPDPRWVAAAYCALALALGAAAALARRGWGMGGRLARPPDA